MAFFPSNPAYLGLTVLLCAVAGLLSGTVIDQIRLVVPRWSEKVDRRVIGDVYRQIPTRPHIVAVRRALVLSMEGRAVPADLAAADRGNGLYAWLDLLAGLRAGDGRPEADTELTARLDQLRQAGPAKLHLQEERSWLAELYTARGVPIRQAWPMADWAGEMFPPLRRMHRPVIRELCDRLEELARRREAAGDEDGAGRVRRAAVRLLMELVRDSPTPEMTLLACERLPPLLERLGAQEARAGVKAFREVWRAAAARDRMNFLPWTGDLALAGGAQDRVLRSLAGSLAGGASLVVWLAMLGVLWAGKGWAGRSPEGVLSAGEARLWRAAVTACLPAGLCWMWLALGDVPFPWLMSMPTLRSAVLLPLWPAALLPLCGHSLWRAQGIADAAARRSAAASKVTIATAAAAAGAAVLVSYAGTADGRGLPPEAWWMRWSFRLAGGMALVVLSAGLTWSIGRIGMARACAGMLSAGCRGAVVLAALTAAWLTANAVLDRLHVQAFAAAAADPVADRAGPDWFQRYFGAAWEAGSS